MSPRRRILRPCAKCGRRTQGTYCSRCAPLIESRRQSRQPYRAAYFSAEYQEARRARLDAAGGRCEAVLAGGERCPLPAQETHHVVPLSTATSLAEAIALCCVENLRAACWHHNPRGSQS